MTRSRILLAFLCVASVGPVATSTALGDDMPEVDSIYSHHDWTDCTLVDASPPDGPGAYAKLVCPGPGDMLVMLSEDDARVSLGYADQAQFGPWESFQTFNDVTGTIEWRRQRLDGDRVPFATIHRWMIGSGEQQHPFLVVSTVSHSPDAQSCMVGYIDASDTPDANKMALRVADHVARDFTCGNDRPRAFGWVDILTPTPTRAGR